MVRKYTIKCLARGSTKETLSPIPNKACSDVARKTHQPGLFCSLMQKMEQIEKIRSTAFYAANYAGLNEPLVLIT